MVLIFSISAVQKNASAETDWNIYELNHENKAFKVPFKITNGALKEIDDDWAPSSYIFYIESDPVTDDVFEIVLPRVFINANIGGKDDEFILLVNGEETQNEELTNSACFRTISFEFTAVLKK